MHVRIFYKNNCFPNAVGHDHILATGGGEYICICLLILQVDNLHFLSYLSRASLILAVRTLPRTCDKGRMPSETPPGAHEDTTHVQTVQANKAQTRSSASE